MTNGRMFPGYGRGWGEEKATGKWARFLQIMREPATKDTWLWLSMILFVAAAALVIVSPMLTR